MDLRTEPTVPSLKNYPPSLAGKFGSYPAPLERTRGAGQAQGVPLSTGGVCFPRRAATTPRDVERLHLQRPERNHCSPLRFAEGVGRCGYAPQARFLSQCTAVTTNRRSCAAYAKPLSPGIALSSHQQPRTRHRQTGEDAGRASNLWRTAALPRDSKKSSARAPT